MEPHYDHDGANGTMKRSDSSTCWNGVTSRWGGQWRGTDPELNGNSIPDLRTPIRNHKALKPSGQEAWRPLLSMAWTWSRTSVLSAHHRRAFGEARAIELRRQNGISKPERTLLGFCLHFAHRCSPTQNPEALSRKLKPKKPKKPSTLKSPKLNRKPYIVKVRSPEL